MKPRISLLDRPQGAARLWACIGPVGIGTGFTPAEAYANWRALVRADMLRRAMMP